MVSIRATRDDDFTHTNMNTIDQSSLNGNGASSRRDGRSERPGRYDDYHPRRDTDNTANINKVNSAGDRRRDGREYRQRDGREYRQNDYKNNYRRNDNGDGRDRSTKQYREYRGRDPRDTYQGRQGRYGPSDSYRSRETTPMNDQYPHSQGRTGYLPHQPSPRSSQNYRQGTPREGGEDPDTSEYSKEELISRCVKKLSYMNKVQPIDEVKIIDSQWGVKPKGFEKVTVQRAKLSGLFPLPGYPRPVDFTKLEDSISNSKADLFYDSYKIDPSDSRNAKIVIVKDIDFDRIDHLKVADYLNKFLAKIDITETSVNNIESKRKTKDDRNLIVQFNNNICATIISSLNGSLVPITELRDDDDDEEDGEQEKFQHGEIRLTISRPGEYVTQCLPPYKEINTTDIEETVADNPRKITVLVDENATDTEIINALKLDDKYQIKGFQLLREIGTRKSLGIAFVEYFFDPLMYKNTIRVIPKIESIIEQLKSIQSKVIVNAFLSCVIPGKTGIEDCPMDFNSLKALAKGEYVTNHPKLKVIELINLVTPKDLADDSNYKFIHQDILLECKTFGAVVSMKIPRTANDFTPGISQFSQPGLGKVYVEFEEEQMALDAIMGLSGRMYNDRTVLCAFHNHLDYLNGIL